MKGLVIFVAVCVAIGTFPVAADNWNEDFPQVSLHPLYTESDLVFLPELVGTWQEDGGVSTLTFERLKDTGYILTVEMDGMKSRLEARLLRLGDELFLDLYPSDDFGDKAFESEVYQPILPVHVFGRLRIEGDKLQFSTLHNCRSSCRDEDLEENKTAYGLPAELIEGEPVLSATTEQLQEFVLQHIEEYFSFKEDDFLRRVLPPEGEESEIDGAESETNCTILRDKEEIR